MDSIIIVLPVTATEEDLNEAVKRAKEELKSRRKKPLNPNQGYVACFVDERDSFEAMISTLCQNVRKEIAKEREITEINPITWDEFGRIIVKERDKIRSGKKSFLNTAMLVRIAEAGAFDENILYQYNVSKLKELFFVLLS